MSVTSSAYSRSPPTGMPAGDPGDAADLAGQALVEVHRRRLALERRVGGEDDLDERRRLGRLVDAREQLPDLQPVRPDPVDRRDRAVEHVVHAAELAGPLEGEDVERLLDDAQPATGRGRGRGRSGRAARR